MAKIKKLKYEDDTIQYAFMCPGCNILHHFNTNWKYDEDFENPTVKPSLLWKGMVDDGNGGWKKAKCHSYITEGKIKFLHDCSHSMKSTTVELPEIKTE